MDKNVFQTIDSEVEARKRADSNWKFANQLSAGKALMSALGLDVDTTKENQIFLQMPLPSLTFAPQNEQGQPEGHVRRAARRFWPCA